MALGQVQVTIPRGMVARCIGPVLLIIAAGAPRRAAPLAPAAHAAR